MRYGSPAAAWMLLIWAGYAWFHDHSRTALIVFTLIGVGAVIVAFQFWRESRRDLRAELLKEFKREREADR
jgi:hypothetical protein